jgi:sialidase-1
VPTVDERVDVTVYRDPAAYASHPCVVRLHSGDLLVAFNETLPRRPPLHPPDDPRSMTLVARSFDQGQTWQPPRAAPDYQMTGVECPSIAQTAAGTVLLIQWRFAWCPLETARGRARSGEPFVLPSRQAPGWEGAPVATEADWDTAALPWARTDDGLYCSISTDDGRTWGTTVRISIAPYRRGYSSRPPAELPDGTLLLALGSHDASGRIYLVRSTDGGANWQSSPLAVCDEPPLSEPAIAVLPSGALLIASRDDASGSLYLHRSLDAGRSWTAPHRSAIRGYPAHLVVLDDGRLLVVYGVRRPPFSIRARVSADEGESWSDELIVRENLPTADLGYPTAVQLPDGVFFTAYYAEDGDGVTHIIGSRFRIA